MIDGSELVTFRPLYPGTHSTRPEGPTAGLDVFRPDSVLRPGFEVRTVQSAADSLRQLSYSNTIVRNVSKYPPTRRHIPEHFSL
jgi:hypothetical protein